MFRYFGQKIIKKTSFQSLFWGCLQGQNISNSNNLLFVYYACDDNEIDRLILEKKESDIYHYPPYKIGSFVCARSSDNSRYNWQRDLDVLITSKIVHLTFYIYSTVTLFARFLGLSTSSPFATPTK